MSGLTLSVLLGGPIAIVVGYVRYLFGHHGELIRNTHNRQKRKCNDRERFHWTFNDGGHGMPFVTFVTP